MADRRPQQRFLERVYEVHLRASTSCSTPNPANGGSVVCVDRLKHRIDYVIYVQSFLSSIKFLSAVHVLAYRGGSEFGSAKQFQQHDRQPLVRNSWKP